MPSSRFISCLLIILLALLFPIVAAQIIGKWPYNRDLIYTGVMVKNFSAQLWSEEFYPRWLENANAGFGSPIFVFYGPLPYYAMSLLQWAMPFDVCGFYRVMAGLYMGLVIAGITTYRWLKTESPDANAETGALLYVVALFIYIQLSQVFAVSQLWGIALFPLVLEASGVLIRNGWAGVPKLSIALALLFFTHSHSALIFVFILFPYVLFFSSSASRLNNFMLAVFSVLLGAGLASIYLLPAVFNREFISESFYTAGAFLYSANFLEGRACMELAVQLIPLALLMVLLPRAQLSKPVCFWLVMIVFALFMNLPISKPVWSAVTPLQYLQFPLRFTSIMIPGVVYITCLGLPLLHGLRLTCYTLVTLITIGLAMYFSPGSDQHAHLNTKDLIADMMDYQLLPAEYETRFMRDLHLKLDQVMPRTLLATKEVDIIKGSGVVTITGQKPRSISLTAHITSADAVIVFKRFYFPGWVAEPSLAQVAAPYQALLSIRAPKGDYAITLSLPWFAGERNGLIVSLCAVVILVIVLLMTSKNLRKASHGLLPEGAGGPNYSGM